MRGLSKRWISVLSVAALSCAVLSPAFAEESQGEKSITGFFKRLFNYPVKATKETAGMTANTVQNTGEKIVEPVLKDTAAIVTGDLAKTGDLVAQPVVGSLETAGQTTAETVQIPVKSAEEETPPAPTTT